MVSCFLIFVLLVPFILSGCIKNDMHSKEALSYFTKLVETKNFDDLSLTIYYLSPYILTRAPLSVDELISFRCVKKIVVSGDIVKEHINAFEQISKDDLLLVNTNSRINARFYYVFEDSKEGKILDVAMWGDHNSVFVNGIQVNGKDIFFDVIMPFLSEGEIQDLNFSLGNN